MSFPAYMPFIPGFLYTPSHTATYPQDYPNLRRTPKCDLFCSNVLYFKFHWADRNTDPFNCV